MASNPEDHGDLIELKARFLNSVRSGDVEEAIDASIAVYAHHGIVRGNTAMMDRALVLSGVVDGIKDRKRIARLITNQISKTIASDEKDAAIGTEPDYEAALADE